MPIEYEIEEFKEELTNNETEYIAIIKALKKAEKGDTIITDSQLIERQIKGKYQTKDEKLKKLNKEAIKITKEKQVKILWLPREKNLAGIKLDKTKK